MGFETIIYETDGPLAWITLNRPDKLNAINSTMVSELKQAMDRAQLNEEVRGKDVFIIQSSCPPVQENLVELMVMIDCVKRASAGRVTAVMPYFGYARQDRREQGQLVPIPILERDLTHVLPRHRDLAIQDQHHLKFKF